MRQYFVNFVKSGNPNGAQLAPWPQFATGQRLIIDVHTRAGSTAPRSRYQLLERCSAAHPE